LYLITLRASPRGRGASPVERPTLLKNIFYFHFEKIPVQKKIQQKNFRKIPAKPRAKIFPRSPGLPAPPLSQIPLPGPLPKPRPTPTFPPDSDLQRPIFRTKTKDIPPVKAQNNLLPKPATDNLATSAENVYQKR
jgi:hypothetical protein